MLRVALMLFLVLSACNRDETVSGQTAPSDVWRLTAIDEASVAGDITIRFPEEGRIAGTGPCNIYSAEQSAPLPWIDIDHVIATRRACPDLAAEARYFKLLEKMVFIEVLGDTILMTAEDGTTLTFRLSK